MAKKKRIDYWAMPLSELMVEVDRLFPTYRRRAAYSHNYSLNKFPVRYGWSFGVTNSWHKWLKAGLKLDFGNYLKPEHAVAAFLDYVREKKINVRKLTD